MSELKPPEVRQLQDPYEAINHDPEKTTRHRRTIIDSSPKEQDEMALIVITNEISDSPDFPLLEEKYPNYRKALWAFERAPRNKQITIQSARNIYRKHMELRYQVEGEEPLKGVILKDTRYARMERMMAQFSQAIGLPSYKVLPVDGTAAGGAYWDFLHTGKFKTYPEGFELPVEQAAAILPSEYAVIEELRNPTAEDFRHKLWLLDPDQQRTFLQNLGQQYAADFIFARTDEKHEHLFIDPDTMAITKIDSEQSLHFFSDTFYGESFMYDIFASNLPSNEQVEAYEKGVRHAVSQTRDNLPQIQEILRRNVNFGITGKEGKVEPRLLQKIQTQIGHLDQWTSESKPK